MANTGFKINPSVIQVFKSGPNSGSVVDPAFNITFNPGTGYEDDELCDTTYYYKQQDLEGCPVDDECPTPNFEIVTAVDCSNTRNREYKLIVSLSNEATTLFVEYSTQSNFSSNVGTYSKAAGSSSTFTIDISDLPSLPVSKETTIYFRCYFDCGSSNTGDYSTTRSVSCPAQEAEATISTGTVQSNGCYSCVSVTVSVPRNSSRKVVISKSGTANWASGFCRGSNQVTENTTETITATKIYSIGLDGSQVGQQNQISRISIQVSNNNRVEDSYILTRQHSVNRC